MAQNDTLSERLALAIASGSSVTAAAEAVGCSRRHAFRLLRDEDTRRRVAELRYAISDQAVGRLSAAATAAVDKLVGLLDSDDESTQLAAAKSILGLLPRVAEHVELRHRLDLLENRSTPPPRNNDAT